MCDNSVQKNNNKEKQKQKQSPTHQDYLHQKCLSCKCKHSLLVFILPPLYFLNSHQPNTFHKTDKYIFFFKQTKRLSFRREAAGNMLKTVVAVVIKEIRTVDTFFNQHYHDIQL